MRKAVNWNKQLNLRIAVNCEVNFNLTFLYLMKAQAGTTTLVHWISLQDIKFQ
jgi:hypothetical protein